MLDVDEERAPLQRPSVQVNAEHLKTMTEMGFPEDRCKRALKYFSNNIEIALQHVMSTDELEDDRVLGPEQPDDPVQAPAMESQTRPAQIQTTITVNRSMQSNNFGTNTNRLAAIPQNSLGNPRITQVIQPALR